MPSRVIRSPEDRERLFAALSAELPPFTVAWKKGAHRTKPQNRLSWKWYTELAAQMDDREIEDVRAYCKLHYGVPILRAEDHLFRATYDKTIKPLDYEDKIAAFKQFQFPVSSLMSKPQMIRYLDTIQRSFLERGYTLTDPDPAYLEWRKSVKTTKGE
ncbi:MAG: hypothetical protein ACE5FM_08360 [Methyloligellaceae bacterium]